MKKSVALLLIAASSGFMAHAQTIGSVVSGSLEMMDTSNSSVYANVPLPEGSWEVFDSATRTSNGGGRGELRDVRLMQFSGEPGSQKLLHAIEITMKVNSLKLNWLDEPCKVDPVLAKNDFGTSMFKQKCLTLRSELFLQNNNKTTLKALEMLAGRKVTHDYNALVLTYSRYGDFGQFLVVREYFFPSAYGLDNPKVAIANDSPWHPVRFAEVPQRKAFADAVFAYGEKTAPAFDLAYMRKDPPAVPAFKP